MNKKTIDQFRNQYRFLSNFWPCKITYNGEEYNSVEHAYQAAKTLNKKEREYIGAAKKPGDAKRRGRTITLRLDWEHIKLAVMEELVRQKFTCHHILKVSLLATGDSELVEENLWHDNVWGSCACEKCRNKGHNHLGKILMKIRQELRV